MRIQPSYLYRLTLSLALLSITPLASASEDEQSASLHVHTEQVLLRAQQRPDIYTKGVSKDTTSDQPIVSQSDEGASEAVSTPTVAGRRFVPQVEFSLRLHALYAEMAALQTPRNQEEALILSLRPYQQAAMDMAQFFRLNSQEQELLKLAEDIMATQSNELKCLAAALKAIPSDTAASNTASHAASHAANNAVSSEDRSEASAQLVEAVKAYTAINEEMQSVTLGNEFDTVESAFIKAMLPNHQAIVQMAQVYLSSGTHPALIELCQAIIKNKSAAIKLMQDRLASMKACTPESRH